MENLWQKYNLGIAGFLRRKINDEQVVEELTNDVLAAAYRAHKNFRREALEFSWICGIAKHKVVDYYRKKRIKTVLFSVSPKFEEIADKALNPERDVLKEELKSEIKKTLKDLGAGYRRLLRLKYVHGHKTAVIAKMLNTTVKAIESRLSRAKNQFKKSWNYDKEACRETVEAGGIDRHPPRI